MRRFSLLAALLSGCLHHANHVSVDGAVLGRVVIYRNGVAFYERRATVVDGKLAIHVPRDRVDDFLKSLTVVDPVTRKPLSVSIPRQQADEGGYLTMMLEAPDPHRTDVLLTYVTEAPAWKPSYRVVVGPAGKVMLEGWAIVDNVSGEDWKDVLVGVGASSALSFRYDLWSVRHVDRDLLQGEDRFAIAPPTGVSPYGDGGEELVSLDADEVKPSKADAVGVSFSGSASLENHYVVDGVTTGGSSIRGVVTDSKSGDKLAGVTVIATSNASKTAETAITDESGAYRIEVPPGDYNVTFYYADLTIDHPGVHVGKTAVASLSQKLDTARSGGETIQVAAKAPLIDPTSTSQSITLDRNYIKSQPAPGRTFEATLGAAAGSQGDQIGQSFSGSSSIEAQKPPPPAKRGDAKLHGIVQTVLASHKDVVIETHGTTADEAARRAASVRDKLVDEGVSAARIHVVPKIGSSEQGGVRVLAIAPGATPPTAPPTAHSRAPGGDDPVGESHFMADRPMNVRAGTSAMVAMVHGETDGGVVYLYDPVSDRGDQRFAFKSVRLTNPTNDTLEPGPVTVYGDGRFVGEGITEPVPPQASVVVPFALDKQVVVSSNANESESIAKLVTAERGVVTAELQRRRQTRFTLTSRLTTPTKVFLRHRLEPGWTVAEAPPRSLHVGDSQLYEVDLGPNETKYVTLAEATPIERTFDLSSEDALGMMQVYIDEPNASPQLKEQITALLATHRAAADLVDKIKTLHEQLDEYRVRSGELHGQLVTLKLVRTSGELMNALHGKLVDTQERMQKTTLAIVDAQEQLMLSRVKFQNQLADLHLTDATVTKR